MKNAVVSPMPVARLLGHLDALTEDLSALEVPEMYRPLCTSGLVTLRRLTEAGHRFEETGDAAVFNQNLVLALMDFLLLWETWLDTGVRFRHSATMVFHRILLRATKGIVKRWRLWRVDITGN